MLRLVLGKRSVQIHGVFGLDRLVPHTPESFGFWVGACRIRGFRLEDCRGLGFSVQGLCNRRNHSFESEVACILCVWGGFLVSTGVLQLCMRASSPF